MGHIQDFRRKLKNCCTEFLSLSGKRNFIKSHIYENDIPSLEPNKTAASFLEHWIILGSPFIDDIIIEPLLNEF